MCSSKEKEAMSDITIEQLVDAVKHVPADGFDTFESIMRPGLRHVLVTRIEKYAAAVGMSNHRITLATAHSDAIGHTPTLVDVIRPMCHPDCDPDLWPDWRGAMDKVRGHGRLIDIDRRQLLGALMVAAVRVEQMTTIAVAQADQDGEHDPCCPCDSPGRALMRDAPVAYVALRIVDGDVEVDSLSEHTGRALAEARWNERADDTVYGINWWYLVQALTFARSDSIKLTLRPSPKAIEVWSEGDGIALTSIMMPVELADRKQAAAERKEDRG